MKEYEDFFQGTAFYGAIGMHNLSAPLSEIYTRKEPLTAYHVLWTGPYRYKNPGLSFEMSELDLITARLSAAAWRRYNGPIYMLTDRYGHEYLKSNGMEDYYDEICPVLDECNYGLFPPKYWAAGKIHALSRIKAPCVILDMDMIVWRPLEVGEEQLIVTHSEDFHDMVYPDFSYFNMRDSYQYPLEWDFTVKPLNTSLLYIKEEAFKQYYGKEALHFMLSERNTPDTGVQCMVFAEQRILGMCADAKGIKPKMLVDYHNLLEKQKHLTHIWSAKRYMQKEKKAGEIYLGMCREKIKDCRNTTVPCQGCGGDLQIIR